MFLYRPTHRHMEPEPEMVVGTSQPNLHKVESRITRRHYVKLSNTTATNAIWWRVSSGSPRHLQKNAVLVKSGLPSPDDWTKCEMQLAVHDVTTHLVSYVLGN